jgi:hypothetical protein
VCLNHSIDPVIRTCVCPDYAQVEHDANLYPNSYILDCHKCIMKGIGEGVRNNLVVNTSTLIVTVGGA